MIEVKKHGTRHFAVYENGDLLAVCVYKKGAYAVKGRIDTADNEVVHLRQTVNEMEMRSGGDSCASR